MEHSKDRGRSADVPGALGKKAWKDILFRLKDELSRDNVSLVAAGVGFFALLAAFPALTAAVSLYGVFADPQDINEVVGALAGVVPGDVREVIDEQLTALEQRSTETLSIGALVGVLIALWSARKGMTAVIAACNIAYDEYESRGFFRQLGLSLAFTVGAVVFFVLTVLLAAGVPVVAQVAFGESTVAEVVSAARWPLLWLLVVLALAVIYRYAPSRDKPRWRWVTWGSAIAATLWVLGSVAFAIYVENFGNYDEAYGSIGAVVVLMMWLYLSGFVVVLGAEINAEMEHQTTRDTTVGPREPMGERDAHVADTIGRATK